MTEIVLTDIVKTYRGNIRASDHLSLTVRDGEYLCLLGPTGAGKTTLLREICGLTVPDSGKILFDGKDVTGTPISVRKATMLSQKYALFPSMDVYGNVVFAPRIKKWSEEDTKRLALSMIELVHMTKKTHSMPWELSGGQQQRTALARALASESDVLLLDEPLRALDARLRLELRKELRSMVRSIGITSIHVTHDQDEAMEMADRIAIIRRGRVIQIGTPMEVFENPATPFVANFLGRSNIFTGKVVSSDGGRSVIEIAPGKFVYARHTDIPEGGDVVVTVKLGATLPRPINAKVDAQDRHTPALYPGEIFRGTVRRVLYEGATITIDIEVEGVGIISARRSSRRYEAYYPGCEVAVSWQPEKASVFPIPENGLDDELRLD